MNLELTNTMPFGKHRGKTIEAIFKDEDGPGYLVWMRQTRKDEHGEEFFFSLEVSQLLDMAIVDSRSLKRKYKPWNLAISQGPSTAPKIEEPAIAYGGWGNF